MGHKLIKYLEAAGYNRKLFYLDRGEEDLPPVNDKNDIQPGSEARSLVTGAKWVLSTEYKWIPLIDPDDVDPIPEIPAIPLGTKYVRQSHDDGAEWVPATYAEKSDVGDIGGLKTSARENLVEAVNEIYIANGAERVFVIDPRHFFVNESARDSYFLANPNQLRVGMLVSADEGFYMYENNLWIEKTAVVMGPQGPIGSIGPQGIQGQVGPQGQQGENGIQGQQGIQGPQGESAPININIRGTYEPGEIYDINDVISYPEFGSSYVARYDGVDIAPSDPLGDENWSLLVMSGPVGPQGIPGPIGSVGPVGPQGEQGIEGQRGPIGPEGPQGDVGLQGVRGPDGPIGPQGPIGPIGPQGIEGPEGIQGPMGVGAQGPAGPQGVEGPAGPPADINVRGEFINGQIYNTHDAVTYSAYGSTYVALADGISVPPTNALGDANWGLFVIQGQVGPQGVAGSDGAPGPIGPVGPKGDIGPIGPRGEKGDTGEQGLPGALPEDWLAHIANENADEQHLGIDANNTLFLQNKRGGRLISNGDIFAGDNRSIEGAIPRDIDGSKFSDIIDPVTNYEEIYCEMVDLQATINKLPKYLDHHIRITVSPGMTNADINVNWFTGPGILSITTGNAAIATTHRVNRFIVDSNSNHRIHIMGFQALTPDYFGFYSNQNNCRSYVYFQWCQAIGGNKVDTSNNRGFSFNSTSRGYIEDCFVSNKYYAVVVSGQSSVVARRWIGGTNNYVMYRTDTGSILSLAETISSTLPGYDVYRSVGQSSQIVEGNITAMNSMTKTVTLANLQKEIDSLPKYLAGGVTFNVEPGTITTQISIRGFTGPGYIFVRGADLAVNTTHNVLKFYIEGNSCGYLEVRGFRTTAVDTSGFQIDHNGCQRVYIYYCQSTSGSKATSGNRWIAVKNSTVVIASCLASNKEYVVYAFEQANVRSIGWGAGVANNWMFVANAGGIISVYDNSALITMGWDNYYSMSGGGQIINPIAFIPQQGFTKDVTMANLQKEINALGKYLVGTVTFNVSGGTLAAVLDIRSFFGPGQLIIKGGVDQNATTHYMQGIYMIANTCQIIQVSGFRLTRTDARNIEIINCSCGYVYVLKCSAISGSKATSNNNFIYCHAAGTVIVDNCLLNNKRYIVEGYYGCNVALSNITGTGNGWGALANRGAVLSWYGNNPVACDYKNYTAGGIVIMPSGGVIGTTATSLTSDATGTMPYTTLGKA